MELKETLDITQFVLMRDKDKMVYNLYSVLTHVDQSHFVTSCKNLFDNKWYKFIDEKVEQINNFQNDVINFGNPDILFYQKKLNKKNI